MHICAMHMDKFRAKFLGLRTTFFLLVPTNSLVNVLCHLIYNIENEYACVCVYCCSHTECVAMVEGANSEISDMVSYVCLFIDIYSYTPHTNTKHRG